MTKNNLSVFGEEFSDTIEEIERFKERLQADVDAYVEWTKEIWSELFKLKQSRKIHGSIFVPDLEYITNSNVPTDIIDFDTEGVYFGGDEYWAYGGHEYHHYTVPARWWTDQKRYMAEVIAQRDEKLAAHEEMQAKNLESQAANRKAMYEQLKKEFE